MNSSDYGAGSLDERARLGLAIGRRAQEIYERTLERVYRKGQAPRLAGAGYVEYRHARSVFGTLFLARLLITGIKMDADELEWFARSGGAAAREGVPLVETTRGQLYWRDLMIEVAREEAERLHTPPEIAEEAVQVIAHSADATLVRIADAYDGQLRDMNSELVRASQFKSEFLAKMSHQLRTPLTAIIGYCDVLTGGMDGKLTREQSEDVSQIQMSSFVLLELVNEILDLSKIEAGKIDLHIQEMDLSAVVDQVVSSLRQIAERKALRLSAELSPATRTVMGDPGRVREVLSNLVSNALKFTPAGSVRISSSRVDRMAEISVIDTGIGIPREAHERIFEEFRQASDTVARTYGGTGLGLSIARRLVEMQGGRMGLESHVGAGSRFWFTLPISPPPAVAAT